MMGYGSVMFVCRVRNYFKGRGRNAMRVVVSPVREYVWVYDEQESLLLMCSSNSDSMGSDEVDDFKKFKVPEGWKKRFVSKVGNQIVLRDLNGVKDTCVKMDDFNGCVEKGERMW